MATPRIDRRALLKTGAGALFISSIPIPASAAPEDMQAAVKETFGDGPIQEGRVALSIPPISENGFSVPIEIEVDSPMTEADHVRRIAVFSPRNPVSTLINFELGPRAGRAHVSTRIRLAGTQAVLVVAEMSDGSLWSGAAETVVTLAACVVL
ncbi:MAG: SoxY-related AACIE arm protein [Pseudomonadota bacterium]